MDASYVEHIPVLSKELGERINLPTDAVMVDATIGQGGHSLFFGKQLGPEGLIIGFDVDMKSIKSAKEKLKDICCKVVFVHSNFCNINEELGTLDVKEVDFILADLGVCSSQLSDVQMGLSFQTNMPLDMRIDKRLKTTAADIVNRFDEVSLANLIYKFGEERASRRIARFIVAHRQHQAFTSTGQLASIVCKALGQSTGKRKGKIHPATRTFQALRIAVNKELDKLSEFLASVPCLLKVSGYVAVISFHSLEDRLVKVNFSENKRDNIYRVVTKKPVVASRAEIIENPRSRSAKLRIAQRL